MNTTNSTVRVTIPKKGNTNETDMAHTQQKPDGSRQSPVTYVNPRRSSPEDSITLRNHRMGREASKRNMPHAIPQISIIGSPRRNSSDESNETTGSDPRQWFDRSNRNMNTTLDSTLDADPPFFQKDTGSSWNLESNMVPSQSPAYRYVQNQSKDFLRPGITHSSSADDYRSVIDDLTVENKRLKEELKRLRQMGPESLKRDKLFEVKVHGLPSRRKRELEAALRDFTTSLDGSSNGASPARKRDKLKASKEGTSKHASSSSGSNSRPNQTDSAYASMSTGAGSSNQSLPSRLIRQKSDTVTDPYPQDIPEGLLPRFSALTEKEKKKLVVRRLEQIFTGKGLGHTRHNSLSLIPALTGRDVEMIGASDQITEPCREAHISHPSKGKSQFRDDISPSNSNTDHADSRDTGDASGSGSGSGRKENDEPIPDVELPNQRPTRPYDLDPDRPSVPSDNMDYIRHLGLSAPEERSFSSKDVSMDVEGWVYLNLLCNMAQLHMFNVTPAFVKSAVSEKSGHFQLSPDGRKIRWRGGGEGTRFSSDSSGTNSQHGSLSSDTDGSNEFDQRKKQRTQLSGEDATTTEPSKLDHQISGSSDEFHYKPMFVHHTTSSSEEQPSVDDEGESSIGMREESNLGMTSRWNQSGGTRTSQRKRRRDGAIIYYNGAPFCTDLSGDVGNESYIASSPEQPPYATLTRNGSGSSIPFKPLNNFKSHRAMMDLDFEHHDGISEETHESDDIQADFEWTNTRQSAKLINFEASGLGGVTPDDHFVLVVSTSRPKGAPISKRDLRSMLHKGESEETAISKDTAESIVGRLATMSTASSIPLPQGAKKQDPRVDIEYLDGELRQLPPAPLPPPAFFRGAASSSFETATESETDDDDEDFAASPGRLRQPCLAYFPNEELSSGDEEDEDSDDEIADDESDDISSIKSVAMLDAPQLDVGRRESAKASDLSKMTTGSSVATAGGVASGYSSSA